MLIWSGLSVTPQQSLCCLPYWIGLTIALFPSSYIRREEDIAVSNFLFSQTEVVIER